MTYTKLVKIIRKEWIESSKGVTWAARSKQLHGDDVMCKQIWRLRLLVLSLRDNLNFFLSLLYKACPSEIGTHKFMQRFI